MKISGLSRSKHNNIFLQPNTGTPEKKVENNDHANKNTKPSLIISSPIWNTLFKKEIQYLTSITVHLQTNIPSGRE